MPGRRLAGWACGLGVVALQAGCASPVQPPTAQAVSPATRALVAAAWQDRLIDLRTGRAVDLTDPAGVARLLAELRSADLLLLGELHDNPQHHARRAELLAALAQPGAAPGLVAAEHLARGQRVVTGDAPLLPRLQAAGFEPRGWRWPLHQPLFEAVVASGWPLVGANLSPGMARQVVREGASALNDNLRAVLAAAPLAEPAETVLDRALVEGHCGQLPPSRLPGMRLAQRARDASMWLALAAGPGQPRVLLAGNGHVRRDHGVAQIAQAMAPGRVLLSLGFGELPSPATTTTAATPPATTPSATAPSVDGEAATGAARVYDLLWLTPATSRPDPCAGLTLPPPG